MDVNCTRCGASYEFEEGLISAAAMTVKCTQCGHLFKVQQESPGKPQEATVDDATTNDEMSRWRVRRLDGSTDTLESLAELATWIAAGRVSRDHEISRTGQMWRRLGDISELASFFDTAPHNKRTSDPPAAHPVAAPPAPRLVSPLPPTFPFATDRLAPPTPPAAARERHISPPERERHISPPGERRFQVIGADLEARTPAPTRMEAGAERAAEVLRAEPAALRKSPSLLTWALVIVIPLGIAAALAGVFTSRERVPKVSESPARVYLTRAEEAFDSQRVLRFDEAISDYTKALAFHHDDPHILSSISRVYAVWSQWLRFRMTALTQSNTGTPAELESLEQEIQRLSEQAKLYGERAAQRNPGNEEASIALADALRLTGNLVGARAEFDRARKAGGGGSAEALRVAALLAIDEAGGELRAGRTFAGRAAAKDPSLIQVRFLLGLCLLATGDREGARRELAAIVERQADHPARLELERALAAPPSRPAPAPAPSAAPTASQDLEKPGEKASSVQLVRRAEVALEGGLVEAAERFFEQALAVQPDLPRALTGLGYVALERSQPTLAITRFRPAAKRGNPEAWIGLGDAYRRLGRMQDALQAYRTYLQRFPRGNRASIAQRQVELLSEQLGVNP